MDKWFLFGLDADFDAAMRAYDKGEAAEAAGQIPRLQQRHADTLFQLEQIGHRRPAVDDHGGVLVGDGGDARHLASGQRDLVGECVERQLQGMVNQLVFMRMMKGDFAADPEVQGKSVEELAGINAGPAGGGGGGRDRGPRRDGGGRLRPSAGRRGRRCRESTDPRRGDDRHGG